MTKTLTNAKMGY